jgi:hypothetical protein
MGRSEQQTAYRNVFELAKAQRIQLTNEIDSLDHRQSALLSVVQVLETLFAQKMGQQSTPSDELHLGTSHRGSVPDSHKSPSPSDPMTQSYVHQSSTENGIQRRIDMAIGR